MKAVEKFKDSFNLLYKRPPTLEEIKRSFPEYKENIPKIEGKKKGPLPFDLFIIARIIFLIISIFCIERSLYFTRVFFTPYQGVIGAAILSTAWILFSSFSFIGARILKKRGRAFLSFVIIATGFIAIFFSMLTTIKVQYDERSNTLIVAEDMTNNYLLDQLKKEEKDLEDRKTKEEKSFNYTQDNLDKGIEKSDREFKRNWAIKNKIDKIQKDLDNKRAEIKAFLGKNTNIIEKSKRKAFFSMLSSTILKIGEETIEFWIYVFPSIFIDILAPLGLFIAIGGKDEKD